MLFKFTVIRLQVVRYTDDEPEDRVDNVHMIMAHEVVHMLQIRTKNGWVFLYIDFLVDYGRRVSENGGNNVRNLTIVLLNLVSDTVVDHLQYLSAT